MNYTFLDIMGYPQEKEELMRLCEIINNRETYLKKGAKLPKGIIFYGEAGTGKTLFAKVMASVCDLNIVSIDLGDITDEKSVPKKIKKAFAAAGKSSEPTMIFFDEMDKVLPNESEEYYSDRSKTILAQLLTLIDGMDSAKNVIFVATVNDYDSLPASLVRPGRMDKKVHIGLPDYFSRVEILKMYAGKTSCRFGMNMEELAKLTVGFSCAALETLINECILQSDEEGNITGQLIKDRILECKQQDLPRRAPTQADMVDACRNLGCFVVSRSLNEGDYLIRLGRDTVCNLYFNGVINTYDGDYDVEDGIDFSDLDFENEPDNDDNYDDDYDDDEDEMHSSFYYCKADFLNALCALMGGYCAEEVVLKKTYSNTRFLFMTMDLILNGISEAGLLGIELRYSYDRNSTIAYTEAHIEKVNAEYARILAEAYERAKCIVEANAELIKKLMPVLVERQNIFKPEAEVLLQGMGGLRMPS